MTLRVLLIDDDARLGELLESFFAPNGVTLVQASDGGRGLLALEQSAFDAVLLDIMMPGMDGLAVCKRIRAKHTLPILMLTARGDESDRVAGLELGADDYLAKPFSPRELLARLRAVLRRASPAALIDRLEIDGLLIDVSARRVEVDGVAVEMTGLEFDLLTALARRAGRVVSREALLQEAGRGDVVVSERTVDVHVAHLRQKVGDARIRTVRGLGYLLVTSRTSDG